MAKELTKSFAILVFRNYQFYILLITLFIYLLHLQAEKKPNEENELILNFVIFDKKGEEWKERKIVEFLNKFSIDCFSNEKPIVAL